MSESARLEHASATPRVGDAAVDTVTLALRLCHLRLWLFCTLSGSTVDPLGPCPREGKGEGTSQGHMACQLSCPPCPPAPWTGSRRGACPRGVRARGTMAARGPEVGRSGSRGREAVSQNLRRGAVLRREWPAGLSAAGLQTGSGQQGSGPPACRLDVAPGFRQCVFGDLPSVG